MCMDATDDEVDIHWLVVYGTEKPANHAIPVVTSPFMGSEALRCVQMLCLDCVESS
jgi:hypothetical protein